MKNKLTIIYSLKSINSSYRIINSAEQVKGNYVTLSGSSAIQIVDVLFETIESLNRFECVSINVVPQIS